MKLRDLKEQNSYHHFFDNKQDIEIWLENNISKTYLGSEKEWKQKKYKINDDLTVDVVGTVRIIRPGKAHQIPFFPVQFNKVTGKFIANAIGLTTLKGMPRFVGQDVNIGYNHLSSNDIQYLPTQVGGALYMHGSTPGFTTLHNIYKYVHSVGGQLHCDNQPNFPTNILGLLLIKKFGGKGRVKISIDHGDIDDIMNSSSDIHEAQERLIEAGFPEQARV